MQFLVVAGADEHCKNPDISKSFSERSYKSGRLDEPSWFLLLIILPFLSVATFGLSQVLYQFALQRGRCIMLVYLFYLLSFY